MASHKLKVMAKPCDECLFGKHPIVRPGRKAEIVRECLRTDSHFECHKGTIEDQHICCRGFYDRYSTNLIRIMGRLNGIEFVDGPATAPEETTCQK